MPNTKNAKSLLFSFKHVTGLKLIDSVSIPALQNPMAVEKSIYGMLGRFAKPSKTIKVTLDKAGYVPGESINITIETNKDCTKQPIEANLRLVGCRRRFTSNFSYTIIIITRMTNVSNVKCS